MALFASSSLSRWRVRRNGDINVPIDRPCSMQDIVGWVDSLPRYDDRVADCGKFDASEYALAVEVGLTTSFSPFLFGFTVGGCDLPFGEHQAIGVTLNITDGLAGKDKVSATYGSVR